MVSSDERSKCQSGARSTERRHVELPAPRTREGAAKYDRRSQAPDRRRMIPISEPCPIRQAAGAFWFCGWCPRRKTTRYRLSRVLSLAATGGKGRGSQGRRRRRPELASMSDDGRGSLTQNQIDVRLVQNDVYFNKPIRGSDFQLLLLPADTGRSGLFNPKDLSASALHHMAIFALCLGKICHL